MTSPRGYAPLTHFKPAPLGGAGGSLGGAGGALGGVGGSLGGADGLRGGAGGALGGAPAWLAFGQLCPRFPG